MHRDQRNTDPPTSPTDPWAPTRKVGRAQTARERRQRRLEQAGSTSPQPTYQAQPPTAQPQGSWTPPPPVYAPVPSTPARHLPGPGCCLVLVLAGLVGVVLAVYLLFPGRTNILVLGIDWVPWYTSVGRSDTNILATIVPQKPYIGMLSIPRDLWVTIPGIGENRINTAHFFGEAQQPGLGPWLAIDTVHLNFGVDIDYYVRIRFEGFQDVVDAMGGLDITLTEPMAGYEPGKYHLTGQKSLAFVRHRAGEDDFFRMENGQFIIKTAFKQMLNPLKWVRLPAVITAGLRSVDTNIPMWLWPRLGFTFLRVGPDGIDNRTIRREMAVPFTTAEGASVLSPDWNAINPLLLEMFGQ